MADQDAASFDDMSTQAPEVPESVGATLRHAREERGLSLEQVAAETRIAQHHLEAIEADDLKSLPGRTYALGFSRTYAKALGLDQALIATRVREQLAQAEAEDSYRQERREAKFEPGDPAHVPSRGLVFLSVLAVALLVVGGLVFYRTFFAPGSGPGSILDEERAQMAAREKTQATPQGQASAAPQPTGPVVFTALQDDTWVKFYDANGNQLLQKQMSRGETYTVPADAQGPMVWTGRPYAFDITVGGRQVPKLSEEDEIIRDVPVTAQALLARASTDGATPAGAATPAAGAQGTATAGAPQG